MSRNFIVIGSMKSGSTTLFRWLGLHPGVALPRIKEPNFFSDDRAWARGISWYESLFPELEEGQITGEASIRYTDPAVSGEAAVRAAGLVPDSRLIFIARNPLDRARSHYRHEVLRGRERRSFVEALQAQGNRYVRLSRYRDGLSPWKSSFPKSQLRVFSFDALFGEGEFEWRNLLSYLELPYFARPTEQYNVTEGKRQYRGLMRMLYRTGAMRLEGRVPRWMKGLARPLLFRSQATSLLDSSRTPLPPSLELSLFGDDWQSVGVERGPEGVQHDHGLYSS